MKPSWTVLDWAGRSWGSLSLAAALLVAGVVTLPASPALAQEEAARPWSLRDLFMPRRQRKAEPPQRLNVFPPKPKVRSKPATRAKTPARQRPAVAAAPPPVDKKADARTILVVGDFVGAAVAEGLEAAFADNAEIRILDRSSGSSGFVRDDHHDWPAQISDLVAKSGTVVAVVMAIGANDRQQMRVDGTRQAVRSEAWSREYRRRAGAFADTVAATKLPLVWVGAPPFKVARMSSDMLALNEIYRATVTPARGEFVDVWDGFVDESGAFVTTGPDVNGQPVRLRAGDGINFTAAGKRKLAFYAEKPLKKLLGLTEDTPGQALPSALVPPSAALPPGDPAEPAAPSRPLDRTPPIALGDPELDGGAELLGAITPGVEKKPELAASRPIDAPIVPGRADDFTWPRGNASSGSDDRTTAIRN